MLVTGWIEQKNLMSYFGTLTQLRQHSTRLSPKYIYWRKFSKRPASPPTMKSGNMKISVEHTTYTKYTIYLVFQLYLLTLGKN